MQLALIETIVIELAQRSDPANLGMLAMVWWRLDRRLRSLRRELRLELDGEGDSSSRSRNPL